MKKQYFYHELSEEAKRLMGLHGNLYYHRDTARRLGNTKSEAYYQDRMDRLWAAFEAEMEEVERERVARYHRTVAAAAAA